MESLTFSDLFFLSSCRRNITEILVLGYAGFLQEKSLAFHRWCKSRKERCFPLFWMVGASEETAASNSTKDNVHIF